MEATIASKPAMKTGSRQCRPSWSCPCSSASSPSLPFCISCSDWSRADASSSPPSSRSWLVCLWCVGRSSTLWWVRMIAPYISATLTCWPGWLSLSVSSVASFISSWGRKNERRSRAETERRGTKKTPYHNIALCLLPTDHRLTSQQYNKSACVTNYCKHKKETFITAGDLFFVYFRTNYVAIRCWKISHISALWVLTKAKCHYTWFLWWQSVLKMCLEMCWWHVDFCCILASYSASTNTSSVITKTSNPALIQYKDVHSVCGF